MNERVRAAIHKAEALLREGNLPSAHFALKRAMRQEPGNVHALVLSAELSVRNGQRAAAEDTANQLFEQDPASFDASLQRRLGHVCFENEQLFMAMQLFEWAGEKNRLDGFSLYQLGVCLRRLGKMDSAEKRLLDCLRSEPKNPAPYLQLGHVHKAIGNIDRAAHYYKKFISLSPAKKGTGYWCLADLKSYTFSDDERAEIERELERRPDDPSQSMALYFSLGSAAEKKGDYPAAMENFDKGNAIRTKLNPFRAGQYRRIIADLNNVPAEDEPIRRAEGPVPVLIVGLPRSGTTLIEQILSAHSRVQATDELPFLEKIALRLEMNGGYPKRLAALTEQERHFLGRQYLEGARAYMKQQSDYFIDKYPGNFLHVGLVKRIIPESIIIDARRDPRDTAISAYRQLFNARNEFAASFDGIYEYYKGYRTIMDHWQSLYPDRIKTVHYERLVSSADEEISALLDFCGLLHEPGCFEFYKQERAVTTPSASQVSRPMYTSSVGQWRHYEELAADSMARLGSLVDGD